MVFSALSPTAPFPQRKKYELAAILLPILLLSLVVTPYMVVKGTTFLIGVVFYSQPYLSLGFAYLNENYPYWQEAISLQK